MQSHTQPKRKFNVKTLALIGVMSAMVFALSLVSFPIPLGLGDQTRIHLGNIMILLSGTLFGPMVGGLAAGIGSALYDFTNPLYISEAWITFLTKFAMGFAAGWLARRLPAGLASVPRTLAAGLGGQVLYIALYLAKSAIFQHYVYGNPWAAALAVTGGKALVSGINGLIAVAGCVLIAPVLRRALDAAGLFRQNRPAKS